MSTPPSVRLPAAQRRQALLATATRVFAARSYRGVTTAEIAREAGVSEPILYRHFASKRDLYLACLDEAWRDLRASWEAEIARIDDPAEWVPAMAKAAIERHRRNAFLANLWMQAITEAADDSEIRSYLRRHVGEVHDHVAGVIGRCQEAGVVPPDRDASAEAWIFLAVGFLATFGQRLGGVLTESDFAAIRSSRRRWMIQPSA